MTRGTTLLLSHGLFSHDVIISRLIISSHITTQLNYRMAIPARSDFYVIPHFPEVYHGQEVSEALFSAAARRITGQGDDTAYSVINS